MEIKSMRNAEISRRGASTKEASKTIKIDAQTTITDASGNVKTAKNLLKVLTILISLLLGYSSTFAQSGGNGTIGTPYLISNIPDWNWFANYIAGSSNGGAGQYFELTQDIGEQNPVTMPVGIMFLPNGQNQTLPSSGTFDGNNKTIYINIDMNLTVMNHYSLFPIISGNVTIKNLTVRRDYR